MASSFQTKAQLSLKNSRLPPIFFLNSDSPGKNLLFPHRHKPRKNIVELVGKFLKKPQYPDIQRRYAQQQEEAPSLIETTLTIEIKTGNCSHLFVFAVSIRSEKSRFLENCLDQRATFFEVYVLQMYQLQRYKARAFDSADLYYPEARQSFRRHGSLHIVLTKQCSKPCCLPTRCQLK